MAGLELRAQAACDQLSGWSTEESGWYEPGVGEAPGVRQAGSLVACIEVRSRAWRGLNWDWGWPRGLILARYRARARLFEKKH